MHLSNCGFESRPTYFCWHWPWCNEATSDANENLYITILSTWILVRPNIIGKVDWLPDFVLSQ